MFSISFQASSTQGDAWLQVLAVMACLVLVPFFWRVHKRIQAVMERHEENIEESGEEEDMVDHIDMALCRFLSSLCWASAVFFGGFGVSVLWGLGASLLR